MTMVPAQNLISKQHNNHHLLPHKGIITSSRSSGGLYYGGCGGGSNNKECTTDHERFGGLIMSGKTQRYDYSSIDQSCVGSDFVVGDPPHHQYHQYPMADDQDESRTNSLNNDAASSNSNKEEGGGGGGGGGGQDHPERELDDDHEGWLKLTIGGHTAIRQENKTSHRHHDHQVLEPVVVRRGENAIELDLLPTGGAGGGGGIRSASTAMFEGVSHDQDDHHHHYHHRQIGGIPSRGSTMTNFGSGTNFSTTSLMYFQQYYPGSSSTSNFPHHHQEAVNNWTFRPLIAHAHAHPHPQYLSASSSSSSSTSTSSLLMPLQPGISTPTTTTTSYLARHFQLQPPVVDAATAAGPSVNFRVVNPPRRPHSGIWFMLQASQNQAKEPFLPQISKSFLRIKDGRMTVGLLIKYLVNKLRLDSESEIEITCRGQQLLPYLTLQHVRDNIWGPTLTLLPDSSTTDHVMVLHYSRSSTA